MWEIKTCGSHLQFTEIISSSKQFQTMTQMEGTMKTEKRSAA